MQELIQQGNKVYIASYLVVKMHLSCQELSDTQGQGCPLVIKIFHSEVIN